MFKSLNWKLILAFMLVAFITTAMVAVLIRFSSVNRFSEFIIEQQRSALEESLSNYYAAAGSWRQVGKVWPMFQVQTEIIPQGAPPDGQPYIAGTVVRGNFLGLADELGRVVVQVDPEYPTGSFAPEKELKAGAPVMVDGEQVGTILIADPPRFNPSEVRYLRRTYQALFLASLGALLVAFVIGLALTRNLIGPLKDLTRAAQNITRGQLEQQVKVRGSDEIADLGKAFNTMSQEVSRVNQLRKQMTADIAHDLRTPLTVISGYIESMRDGVLKPTPERFSLIYSEIERLQNLVGDLRDLTLADSGELQLHPQPLSPRVLLERAAGLFRYPAEQKGVELLVDAESNLPDIRADEARMMQVLGNLITNAIRYTPAGGKIILSAQANEGGMELSVSDNGEGISAEELPYIFNRFQRGDKSRHAENGESGLGLAIVKTLVESHGGSVTAESAPGQGTVVRVKLPGV